MTYACSAPERGLSLWDWTVGALHQDRCSVGVYRVGSELFGSLLPVYRFIRVTRRLEAYSGFSAAFFRNPHLDGPPCSPGSSPAHPTARLPDRPATEPNTVKDARIFK